MDDDARQSAGTPGAAEALERLARGLRSRVATAPGEERRTRADNLRRHVEEYLLPRAADLDAPLLVVLLGSTGSGKSSLLNALVGARVSPSGVLRPTTRQPIAVGHREDLGGRIGAVAERSGLELRADDHARRGLVLVDAPDFDSVEAENRERALGLLEVADLVIFVTTATRYADQVPWEVLGRARARGVPMLAVLNRLPADAVDREAVIGDFRALLERGKVDELAVAGGGGLEVVAVDEGRLRPDIDALDPEAVAPVAAALDALVASAEERRSVARRGLAAALRGVPESIEAVAGQVDEEQRAVGELRDAAHRSYAHSRTALSEELGRGTFLRAEVLRQWQDFIGAGQVARFLAEGIGRIAATIRSLFVPGPPAPATEVREAAFADLVALAIHHADSAAQRTATAWSADRYGAAALAEDEALWRASVGLPAELHAGLEAWAEGIANRIRELGTQRKGLAQAASLGVNVVGTSAVLAVFVHTGGLTGAEVGITAATAVVNQKLLEALFGEANVSAFVGRAREDLAAILDRAWDGERDRYGRALGSTGDPALARELRDAAREAARAVDA
ncbi:MAG TPA: GTPase domain-containing protein [Candidatus Limnocylindria bacterium]|jgi:energy-coupling factor transporter ATP-binding protein EcfA2